MITFSNIIKNVLKTTIVSLIMIGMSFAQDWDTFDATAYEFSATLSAAQIFVDGELKTTGQLAAFVGDELRGVDLDGATFFLLVEQQFGKFHYGAINYLVKQYLLNILMDLQL